MYLHSGPHIKMTNSDSMAQAYPEQDHDTVWRDNEDMKERTKAYAMKAAAVANKMCRNRNHPWQEDPRRNSWRLRIFDLEGGFHSFSCDNDFDKVRDLLLSWESTRKGDALGNNAAGDRRRSRYVILLEDLSPRVAELLGVLLEIPPEFFLSHCEGTNELSIVDKQMFKKGGLKYWKVAVPQVRDVSRAPKGGSYRLLCGFMDRSTHELNENVTRVSYYNYVSYWANSYGDGSWIAVIITDIHSCHLESHPSNPNHPDTIHLQNTDVFYTNYREIRLDSAEDEMTQPHERSFFDAVANSYDNTPPEFPDDPFSATCVVRNCIRAVWEQRVCWEQNVIESTAWEIVWQHDITKSLIPSEDFENMKSINTRAMGEYQELMGMQEIAKKLRRDIRETIHKFRLRDTYYLAEKTSNFENYRKEEIEVWNFLDEELQYALESLNDHMKMYSARSAMEETYEAKMQSRESMKQTKEANRQTAAANRMARSSGQLTKIATIIVPCTFVASIFSMGGDFAAGESLFYVYWLISVPITVGLLTWILHEDIAEVVCKSKSWFYSRRTKLSKDSMSEDSEV